MFAHYEYQMSIICSCHTPPHETRFLMGYTIFLCRYPAYMSSYLDLQSLRHPSKDKYSSITAYGTSKLCNLLFALQFHRNNVEQAVYCNAVHPGNLLPTNLTRDSGLMCKAAFTMARPFTKSLVSD